MFRVLNKRWNQRNVIFRRTAYKFRLENVAFGCGTFNLNLFLLSASIASISVFRIKISLIFLVAKDIQTWNGARNSWLWKWIKFTESKRNATQIHSNRLIAKRFKLNVRTFSVIIVVDNNGMVKIEINYENFNHKMLRFEFECIKWFKIECNNFLSFQSASFLLIRSKCSILHKAYSMYHENDCH